MQDVVLTACGQDVVMVSLMISLENNVIALDSSTILLIVIMMSEPTFIAHPTVPNFAVMVSSMLEKNVITDATTLICLTDVDLTANVQDVVMVSSISMRSAIGQQETLMHQTPADLTVPFLNAVMDGSISVRNVMMETEKKVMDVIQCVVTSAVTDSLNKKRSAITVLITPTHQTNAEPTADSQFVVMVSLIHLKIVMRVQETLTQHQTPVD